MKSCLIDIKIQGVERILNDVNLQSSSEKSFMKRNLARFSGKFLVLDNSSLLDQE